MAEKQRRTINEKLVRSLRAPPAGQRLEVWDRLLPAFGVRVTDRGAKSYVVYTRWGPKRTASRRTIASCDSISLADARKQAREWLTYAAAGGDPKEDERQAADAAREAADLTFGAVMEEFIKRHVRTKRKARDVEREIRKELMKRFAERPVSEITRKDITKMLREIRDRGALYQAHHVLGHVRKFYNWAMAQEDEFDVQTSPCAGIDATNLIGEKKHRPRTLTDAEICALWNAAARMGYPMGPYYQMLLLTGQRKSEVAGARWRELDLENAVWTIPSERFKSDAVHLVPLSGAVMALLEALPRWAGGDHLFSTTGGGRPVNGFSKAKVRLDALMAEELGAAPEERWIVHDIRRTVRTRLSQLRVEERVAEKVIGHARQGIVKVYDQYEFLDERREALEAWAARVRSIVTPPPPNVVALERARA